jgi:trimeric autotransporter adhesin
MRVLNAAPQLRPRTAAMVAMFWCTVVSTACSGDGNTAPDTQVASVAVSAPAQSLEIGATASLTAVARSAAGGTISGRTFTWHSSNTSVAGVSSSGLVTGVGQGVVTVTATESGSSVAGNLELTITTAAVQSVTVTPATATAISGRTEQLTAVIRDARGAPLAGRAVTWTSADTTIAIVNATGLVTARATGGPVAITASSEGRSGSAQISVAPVPVHALIVSPAGPLNLRVGDNTTLTAVARAEDGTVLTGRVVTWATSNAAIVSVTGAGLVTAVAAGGPVTITASVAGTSSSIQVSAFLVPVASVTIDPMAAVVLQGSTRQLTATPRDAGGAALNGRIVSWASSDSALATVSNTGLVSALAPGGPVTVTATSEGRSASAVITVAARTAARVAITPRFRVLDTGVSALLAAAAYDADGQAIPSPSVRWASDNAAVAAVNGSGSVAGGAAGIAAITAQVDAAVDTAWAAVLGPQSLLSTAFVGGAVVSSVQPGQTVSVVVQLDMSRVSSNGDLGALQFDLLYDPNVLVYASAQSGLSGGVAEFNVPAPGTFKFSYANTAVQGQPGLTLVTIIFQVAPNAARGVRRSFILNYTTAPAGTAFRTYAAPVAAGGRIDVVTP